MQRYHPIILCAFYLVWCFIAIGLTACGRPLSATRLKADTFSRLSNIRVAKKQAVIDYFNGIEKRAAGARRDTHLIDFFKQLVADSGRITMDLDRAIDRHFVARYSDFYDMLFISQNGFVFHSIRREADYHRNIFEGRLAQTNLARQLHDLPDPTRQIFTAYEFYHPSAEAAAFFILPIIDTGVCQGWIALQCATNQVNAIVTHGDQLGVTGEVYLVNQDHMMLTDSRFFEDSTILKLKVDTQAVREAANHMQGAQVIRDYRGVNVFSSFERFDLFGTQWIIIAEIDENEVITEFYRRHKRELWPQIVAKLTSESGDCPAPLRLSPDAIRVDMNEFQKALPGTTLLTHGVATCTAVAMIIKGRFAYLSHIPPMARVPWYTLPWSEDKDPATELVDEIIRRIRFYELVPKELETLQFIVVAPDINSLPNIVTSILAQGVMLANIRLIHRPEADYADVAVEPGNAVVDVRWTINAKTERMCAGEVPNLSTIVKQIIEYPGGYLLGYAT